MEITTSISIGDITQILLGSVTLWVAYLVYKKLLPSEHKKMQLQAVLGLIEHLNTYTFTMHRMYFNGVELAPMTSLLKRNIFEYRAAYMKKDDSASIALCKILLLSHYTHPFELSKYIENPLMPKKVVLHLSDFINMHTPEFNEKFEDQEKVIVFNEFDFDVKKETYYRGTASALLNHNAFLSSINGLYDAIEEWCRLNGLDDLNFRMHNSRNLNSH